MAPLNCILCCFSGHGWPLELKAKSDTEKEPSQHLCAGRAHDLKSNPTLQVVRYGLRELSLALTSQSAEISTLWPGGASEQTYLKYPPTFSEFRNLKYAILMTGESGRRATSLPNFLRVRHRREQPDARHPLVVCFQYLQPPAARLVQ